MSNIFDLFNKIAEGRETTPKSANVEWLIVGLGNIGREYDMTRHNTGFMTAYVLAEMLGVKIEKLKFQASVGRGELNGHGVLLMCPRTYMNSSGEAVRDAAEFYKIPPEHILVICDDVTLDVGRLRVRRSGSNGGHNGLGSIIYQLNSDSFPRIRIGVGKKPEGYDLAAWVLGRFADDDIPHLKEAIQKAADNVSLILDGRIDEAMQICNGFKG